MCKPAKPPQSPAKDSDPPKPTDPITTFPFNDELKAAAAAFKQLFDTRDATYHRTAGQFAPKTAMQKVLAPQVNALKNPDLRAEMFNLVQGKTWTDLTNKLRHCEVLNDDKYRKKLIAGDVDLIRTYNILQRTAVVNTTRAYQEITAPARKILSKLIDSHSISLGDQDLVTNILDDRSGTGEWAYTFFNKWNTAAQIGPTPFDKVSLPRQSALFINGLVMCGELAKFTARKLYNSRGIPPPARPVMPRLELSKKGQKDKRSEPDNTIQAYNPAELQQAIQKASAVLKKDAQPDGWGGYLMAGVLSGRKLEEPGHPFPEHYILLFAVSGNKFLFWDPDVADTTIQDLGKKINPPQDELLGPALGVLFYDTTDPARPTFSTGINFSDLKTIIGGFHADYSRRHRYQVVTLQSP